MTISTFDQCQIHKPSIQFGISSAILFRLYEKVLSFSLKKYKCHISYANVKGLYAFKNASKLHYILNSSLPKRHYD